MINGMIDEIDDLLASGATIEEVALDTDMILKTTSYYEGNGSVGIEASNEFNLEASKILKDDYPTLISLSNGSILAMRLDSIKPPFLQTFETVKDEVKSDWLNIENNKKLKTNGTIDFINGQRGFLSKSIYNVIPKIKELLIFPNYLMHTAYPFNINGERRSFSFNVKIVFK